jgi:hypothetical protein
MMPPINSPALIAGHHRKPLLDMAISYDPASVGGNDAYHLRYKARNMLRPHRPIQSNRAVGSARLQAVQDDGQRTARWAMEPLLEIAKAEVDRPDIQNALGRAYARLGEARGSQNDLRDALVAYDSALKIISADRTAGGKAFCLRVSINKISALCELAALQEPASMKLLLKEADELLQLAFDMISEEAASAVGIDVARANDLRGYILFSQGSIDEALVYFHVASGAWPPTYHADQTQTLIHIGAAYEEKYKRERLEHWVDKARKAYSAALAKPRWDLMPQEWSRAQRGYGDALRQKAYFDTENRESLLFEAIEGLKQARQSCSDRVEPRSRALINISLGDAIGDLAIVQNNSNLAQDAIEYYDDSSSMDYVDLQSAIDERIGRLSRVFINHPSFRAFMDRRARLLSSIQSAIAEQAATYEDWVDVSAQVYRQFAERVVIGGSAQEAQLQPAAAGRAEEQSCPPLPDNIPEEQLFTNRPRDLATGRKQSVEQFLLTGWPAPYALAGRLTMTDFRKLDPAGANALYVHLQHGGGLPDGMKIPQKRKELDEALGDPDRVREARRLARAAARRHAAASRER